LILVGVHEEFDDQRARYPTIDLKMARTMVHRRRSHETSKRFLSLSSASTHAEGSSPFSDSQDRVHFSVLYVNKMA
jgi:hypothetical protein